MVKSHARVQEMAFFVFILLIQGPVVNAGFWKGILMTGLAIGAELLGAPIVGVVLATGEVDVLTATARPEVPNTGFEPQLTPFELVPADFGEPEEVALLNHFIERHAMRENALDAYLCYENAVLAGHDEEIPFLKMLAQQLETAYHMELERQPGLAATFFNGAFEAMPSLRNVSVDVGTIWELYYAHTNGEFPKVDYWGFGILGITIQQRRDISEFLQDSYNKDELMDFFLTHGENWSVTMETCAEYMSEDTSVDDLRLNFQFNTPDVYVLPDEQLHNA